MSKILESLDKETLEELLEFAKSKDIKELDESIITDFKVVKEAKLIKESEDFKSMVQDIKEEFKIDTLDEEQEQAIIEACKKKKLKEEDTEYQKFFKKALEKFGVSEPDELEGDKEKEFYDYVDANWKSDDEKKGINEANLLGKAILESYKGNTGTAIETIKESILDTLQENETFKEVNKEMSFYRSLD